MVLSYGDVFVIVEMSVSRLPLLYGEVTQKAVAV